MLLMLGAGLNAAVFHATVYAYVGDWEHDAIAPARARIAAATSLALWWASSSAAVSLPISTEYHR
jgi:hypothetical protein